LLLDPSAALKLQINKKVFCKAALNFFASVSCFKARNEVGPTCRQAGLGKEPNT